MPVLICSKCKEPVGYCDYCDVPTDNHAANRFKEGDSVRCFSVGYTGEHSHEHLNDRSSGGRIAKVIRGK